MSDAHYRIMVSRRAHKDLKSIDRPHRSRIQKAISRLARNPRPPGSMRLRGRLRDLRRIRSGRYRIVYKIHDAELIVVIVGLGSRQDIYQSLLRFLATLT